MSILITALPFPCSAPAAASPRAVPKTERQNHLLPYFSDLFGSCGLSHFLLQLPEYLWKEGGEPGCAPGQVQDQGREQQLGQCHHHSDSYEPQKQLLHFSTLTSCWEQWSLQNLRGEESGDGEAMANSFLCGLSDPNPSQVHPVLGETPQGVVAPRSIPDCFFHSSKESLAAFHKPMFSFWVNTLGSAHPPLTKRQILCSHSISPLFLSHSRAQAGSHFCDLQKNVPPRKAEPAAGWNRLTKNKSGSNQTKIQNKTLFLPSLPYPFMSPYSDNFGALWEPLEHKESCWVFCGMFISRLQWEQPPAHRSFPFSQEDVHFK